MEFFDILLTWQGWMYFIILALLEIVLGIDNIIFISIVTDKLPEKEKRKARNIGLTLALVVRLILLTMVSWLMQLTTPLFYVMDHGMSGQSIVLLIGGLFLIYKSTVEMHSSVKGRHEEQETVKKMSMSGVIMQIIFVDLIFSFDSVISAIGMTSGIGKETGENPIIIIYMAVIVSMIVMLLFAGQISRFITSNPTIKMIALSFLVTIGVLLVAEAFEQHIPKGYVYFALVYSLLVELLNIRMRNNKIGSSN
jgi:predicted tellurium resistance membrane protein TerC